MTDIQWRDIFAAKLRDAEAELAAASTGDDREHPRAVVEEYRAVLI